MTFEDAEAVTTDVVPVVTADDVEKAREAAKASAAAVNVEFN